MAQKIESISLDEKNRNSKGQFIKGHSLGLRFGFGQQGTGHKHSKKTKEKLSEIWKKKWRTEDMSEARKKLKKMGETRKGKKLPQKVREKIRKALKGKKQPWNQGKNHWNWQGGISEYNRHLNRKKERNYRFKVFQRDNFTCWICEKNSPKLNVHHIKSYAKYPKLRFITNNGLTLCEFCHKTYTNYGSHKQH